MQTTMRVRVKHVYGNKLVYPACDISKAICHITARKTLPDNVLKECRDKLGYKVEVVPETVAV